MSTTAPTATPISPRPRRSPLAYLVRFQSLLGLVIVILAGIAFSPRRPRDISCSSSQTTSPTSSGRSPRPGFLALGMTFVIIAAGIDLSVGAVLGLCSVLTADLLVNEGWGLWTTLPLVLVTGLVFGAVQGAISTKFRIQAFIVTLAGLQAARGLSLIASNNSFININYGAGPGSAPPAFAVLGERIGGVLPGRDLGVPGTGRRSRPSCSTTHAMAVTSSQSAATRRRRGLAASRSKGSRSRSMRSRGWRRLWPASCMRGSSPSAAPTDGTGYELNAIAAVVIGGTDLFGGAGSMVGTIAGRRDAGRARQHPGAQRRERRHAAARDRRHYRIGRRPTDLCGPRRRWRAVIHQ